MDASNLFTIKQALIHALETYDKFISNRGNMDVKDQRGSYLELRRDYYSRWLAVIDDLSRYKKTNRGIPSW